MALIECEEAKMRFQQKLDSGFYKRDRSQNTEVVYAEQKQERDTRAVEEFSKTQVYKELFDGLAMGWA